MLRLSATTFNRGLDALGDFNPGGLLEICRNVVFEGKAKSFFFGAGDRGRTGDVQLGKLAFYH